MKRDVYRIVTQAVVRRGRIVGGCMLLIGLAVLLGGCVTISSLQLNSNLVASSDHRVSMTLTATADLGPIRGVFAVRIPSAWNVKSMSFSGFLNGTATESAVMENVYATDWEATTGPGHNGHKAGYKWWVGYTSAATWTTGQTTTVTIAIDTHARGGTYYLDFAFGAADATGSPEDLADKGTWQIGSTGSPPTGVLLDRAIWLADAASTFSDVYSDTLENPGYPEAVAALSGRGVISGFTDGTFRPHAPVTRQQFAKMIVKDLGLTVTGNESCPFTDVLGNLDPADPFYPDKYVAVCATYGITEGKTPTTFAPIARISRAQLLTMVVRAAARMGLPLNEPTPAYYAGTNQGSSIFRNWDDATHAHNAQVAEFNALLWGVYLDNASAWAYQNATRGEVAQILWRLWQKM